MFGNFASLNVRNFEFRVLFFTAVASIEGRSSACMDPVSFKASDSIVPFTWPVYSSIDWLNCTCRVSRRSHASP